MQVITWTEVLKHQASEIIFIYNAIVAGDTAINGSINFYQSSFQPRALLLYALQKCFLL